MKSSGEEIVDTQGLKNSKGLQPKLFASIVVKVVIMLFAVFVFDTLINGTYEIAYREKHLTKNLTDNEVIKNIFVLMNCLFYLQSEKYFVMRSVIMSY